MKSDEKYASLRAALLAGPTPGPWAQSHRETDPDGMYRTEVYCSEGRTIATLAWYPAPKVNGVTRTYRESNARYIAAANPATIAALLKERDHLEEVQSQNIVIKGRMFDRIKALTADLTEQCRLLGAGGEREARLMAERDALAADVEDLKHDIGEYVKISIEQATENTALAAELERLREDGRRYRAIANVIHVDRISDGKTMLASHWGAWVPGEHCDIDVAISAYADLRAIDAAREGR